MKLETERLILRPWQEIDRSPMAAMCADPDVMWDYGYVNTVAESDARIARYHDAYLRLGYGRFPVLLRSDGSFLGYCGVMPVFPGHPMEPGLEIGWRLIRAAWGKGYASEAARACLRDGFERCGMNEVLSYTAANNTRSEAVMRRIGLTREPSRDFLSPEGDSYVVYVGRP